MFSMFTSKPDTVDVSNTQFTLLHKSNVLNTIKWNEITKIIAFKHDEVTTDLLCLQIITVAGDSPVIIHEELHGFDKFESMMLIKFQTINTKWKEVLMSVPFEMNPNVLYSV